MSDPVPTPPAAPPPRLNWWRAFLIAGLVGSFAISFLAFADGFRFTGFFVAMEAIVVGPLILLAWSWARARRRASDEAWQEFRKLWTSVWLVVVLVATIVFGARHAWRGYVAADVRLAILHLLLWTSALMLVCWRVHRVLLNRTLWKRGAFCGACLATLMALIYGYENWTGKRAWETSRRNYEAKGETLDFRKFHPAPVPDADNVGAHPLFKFPFTDAYRRRKPESAWTPEEWAIWEHLEQFRIHLQRPKWGELESARAQLPMGTNEFRFHDLAKWKHFFHDNTNYLNQPAPTDALGARWRKLAAYPVMHGSTNPAVDVLLALTKLDASFAAVEEALQRPHCRFAVAYEQEDVWGIRVPHLSHTLQMVRAYSLRASARLALGQTDAAFRDAQTSVRLANLLKDEFFFIGLNVHVRAMTIAFGTVAEGMARHQWNSEQLIWFSTAARQCEFLSGYATTQRAEAAGMVAFWTWVRTHRAEGARAATGISEDEMPYQQWFRWLPAGWFYRQQGADASRVLDYDLRAVDLEKRQFVRQKPPPPRSPEFSRDNLIHTVMSLRLNHANESLFKLAWVRGQTTIDQFTIAVALERHWLRHRAYPEKLDALVPEFLDRLPHDLFDGQPMRYRREGGQGFVLWSVGFDGKDDNAGPLHFAGNQGGSVGEEMGDLVWRYPRSP